MEILKSTKKAIYISIGSISLALGIIGLFVPVLPTTPFLLLTAFFYARSSERLYSWLLSNRIFGNYIRRYREGKGIPLKTKILAITVMWISILYTNFFVLDSIILKLIFFATSTAVTIHLVRLPTFRKE